MYQTISEHAAILQKSAVVTLALMAICVVVIAVQKITLASRMKLSSLRLLGALDDNLRHQRIDSTIDVCKSYNPSHLAQVILVGMIERKNCEMHSMPDTLVTSAVREAMDRSVARQVLAWKEHLGLVDAIGKTAPFVGVIIGNAAGLAAGTLLSLVTIWLEAFFRSRGDVQEVELKTAASEMQQFFASQAKCKTCGAESRNLHYEREYTCEHCCPKCRTAA